jgi:membrane-bound lytic murein transglycosylase D
MLRLLAGILWICFFAANPAGAQSDPFPQYPILHANVAFWTDIYTRYASNQGVLHDKNDLSIVYDVIDLEHPHVPGSSRINRQRTREAKKKYRTILRKLAQREPPANSEEQRVVDLLGPETTPSDYYHHSRNLRCQVGQRNFFKAGLIRSGAYLDEIKEIFREHGLPEDLAYLPHVESSFNPRAYSKFGAAGMWQFTRSTGKQYLRVGYSVDERRDPILSSHAAARLLKYNYKRLQNWPLAVTAYNHGINGMLRAKRSRGTYEAIFNDYRSRLFGFASRNFYSEFLAAREVAKNYRLYFGELAFDPPLDHDRVILPGYVLLPELTRQMDVEMEVIRRLNPALRKPVVTGQKYVPRGYRLNLPANGRDWESLLADLSEDLFKDAQKRSRFYKVRRGDTASEIARRHGVRLSDLVAANNLDVAATIHVNQTLTIPLPDEPSRPASRQVAKQQRLPAPRASQKPPPAAPTPEKTPVLIAQADTASQPAPEPQTDRETPAESPPQKPAELPEAAQAPSTPAAKPVPQRPSVAPAPPAVQPAESPASEPEEEMDSWMVRYKRERMAVRPTVVGVNLFFENVLERNGSRIGILRVEVEETLGHYAEWAGVRTQDIRRLNGLSYGRLIHLGQPLKIPLHRVAREDFETQRHEYHKELVEDFMASYRVEEVQSYTIKRGDNIWTLSREEFELPLWLIRRYNLGVDFNSLMPSQTLLVPIVEKLA